MLDKVLIINTGGTIGMVHSDSGDITSPLRPANDWNEIIKDHPILNRYHTDYYQFDPLIDSSDMEPKIWRELAQVIAKNYDNYRGFVILHGTDTMAYTASALSFMLKNLKKPVVLTGSQVPLQFSRSDALQNLVTAIHIAGNELYGVKLIPEVCIFFRDTLLRGNRSSKVDATNYFGFSSPNYPPIAEVGADIRVIKDRILKVNNQDFYIDTAIDNNVIVLELFPGLMPQYIKNIVDSCDIKGVILKTFGNGNAPTNREFLEVLEYITKKGVVVVDITQCNKGFVKMGLYEASAGLSDMGIIGGFDLTLEAGITKLMYLLGKNLSLQEIREQMQIDICGEQTISQYEFLKDDFNNLQSTLFEYEINLPKSLKNQDLIQAVVRVRGISKEGNKEEKLTVELVGEKENKISITQNLRSDRDSFHINFNYTIKPFIQSNEKLKIKFVSNCKISIKSMSFSVFSESLT